MKVRKRFSGGTPHIITRTSRAHKIFANQYMAIALPPPSWRRVAWSCFIQYLLLRVKHRYAPLGYNIIPLSSAACRYSLPLALHQLYVIRQIRCAYRNTRSTHDLTGLFGAATVLLLLLRCEVLTHMRAKQSPSPPPVGTFPRCLTSIFRTPHSLVKAPGGFTK